MNAAMKARNLAGVLLKEWGRYERALIADGPSYLALCNRNERLESSPTGLGYRCQWQWTSDLHAPKVLPALGLRLMKRALMDHPIKRAASPQSGGAELDISFIIGHRGMNRLRTFWRRWKASPDSRVPRWSASWWNRTFRHALAGVCLRGCDTFTRHRRRPTCRIAAHGPLT